MDVESLRVVEVFAGLPAEELEVIAPLCSRATVMPGTYLVKEGDFGYKFFGILSGYAVVTHENVEIARLEVGEVFGEMALFEDERRNANVVAGTECQLATMMSWDFRHALDQCPQFKATMDRLSAARAE